ncbi:N,N-dimethylformamidase beta subunit family domain-containing protein [Streptomyces qinzhouensis]|uniref:N,N-dimethylformamidase beta subunit family domain-containing protein n=1 Tax=Streptomyces qinzhouensis TaxID=2599401 RepID=UPI0016465825|nr:N,N-dimethylformamidase beta subunit family domain-containing protein [Streptomyces qinzhouensis]
MSSRPPRRSVLSLIALATAGTAFGAQALREKVLRPDRLAADAPTRLTMVEPAANVRAPAAQVRSIVDENLAAGSRNWIPDQNIGKASSDTYGHIMGYTSTTSAGHGDAVDFHVSVRSAKTYRVSVFRIGYYGGKGARLMTTSPVLTGRRQAAPVSDRETGALSCAWARSWGIRVPESWRSGLYQAVFTTADGYRSSTPFVVREPQRSSALLCVIPFTTYQAYNMWPKDGKAGKNLYGGYLPGGGAGGAASRSLKVSFDRPYSGAGTPSWFNMDTSFVRWAEERGYDITYASSVDLHDGSVDPARYRAVFFPGHDEYWSKQMYDSASGAVAAGRNLAFLGANNVYFHVRLERSATGRPDRVMACYKSAPDPGAGESGATTIWRSILPDRALAEQRLLGIQFSGIVKKPTPLVVRQPGHWLWRGTGVKDGEQLANLVGVEADCYDIHSPQPQGRRTLLADSRYEDSKQAKTKTQHTAVTEHTGGGTVFMAGTFHWPLMLVDDDAYTRKTVKPSGATKAKIRRATANAVFRLTAGAPR